MKVRLEDLYERLRLAGALPSAQLATELGISRPTLSRLVKQAGPELLVLGGARSTRYALLRPFSAGSEIPVFAVDERGRLSPLTTLQLLYGKKFLYEGQVVDGLPPGLVDMAPQGFMGRAFAKKHGEELGLPARLQDWSDDHVILALARRGENAPGNLVVGSESASRFHALEFSPQKRKDYPAMAAAAYAGQPVGSSAGGEQPKFSCYVDGYHCLVKFAGPGKTPADQRLRDLLRAEALALETLRDAGISTAEASVSESGLYTFLEIRRFDREGAKGRHPVLSLATLMDHYVGSRSTWTESARQLEAARLISPGDAKHLRFLDAFGLGILDGDRHPHNISFVPAAGKASRKQYALAPAYDKLPMNLMPVNGMLRPPEALLPPVPVAAQLDVWNDAMSCAKEFWRRVRKEKKISAGLKEVAAEAERVLA